MKPLTLIALVLLAGCGAYERQKAEEAAEKMAPAIVVTQHDGYALITLRDGTRCVAKAYAGGIDCDFRSQVNLSRRYAALSDKRRSCASYYTETNGFKVSCSPPRMTP